MTIEIRKIPYAAIPGLILFSEVNAHCYAYSNNLF